MKSLQIIMFSVVIILSLSSNSGAQINHTVHILLPGHLPPPSICMITVDPVAEKNIIVWEKTIGIGISSYNVYREVRVRNNYVFLGNVPFLQISAFTDTNSFPQRQQYRYKISAIDTCGNESAMSPDIKPFFLSVFFCSEGNCLAWEPSKENEVECLFNTIIIYRGTDPLMLFPVDTIPAFNSTYVDLKENLLYNGKIYYRIAGVKEIPCNADQLSNNNNAEIIYSQVFSNLVSLYRDPTNFISIEYSGKISISPNPFENETILKWENTPYGNSDLFLYDLKGTLIKKISGLEKSEYILQRENLPGGCYIIEIKGNKRYYGKLLVV